MFERCAECRFFCRVDDGGGECRHAPPLVAVRMVPGLSDVNPQLMRVGYWPPVAAGDWCGQWKHQAAAPADVVRGPFVGVGE